MIQKLRRKPIETETILWDGTAEVAREITEWMAGNAAVPGFTGFITADNMPRTSTTNTSHAALWVQHNRDWVSLPIGYRVAKELDGSGFYPLSPQGVEAGYELLPEVTS